jgi:protein-tyrosine phosphatase
MKILMVCLGNICRSPLAEGVMRQKAAERNIELTLDSCGTSSYHIGEPPDPRSIDNARRNGVDISDLRARQFSVEDFKRFDRIYVMDESNYDDVMRHAAKPEYKNKVRMILNELHPGSNQPVPDPYFGGDAGFQHVFELLNATCDKILDEIEK